MKTTFERILWAVKIEDPSWKESIITTNPDAFEAAKEWAIKNGFNRFRISTLDLTVKPDFSATLSH